MLIKEMFNSCWYPTREKLLINFALVEFAQVVLF